MQAAVNASTVGFPLKPSRTLCFVRPAAPPATSPLSQLVVEGSNDYNLQGGSQGAV